MTAALRLVRAALHVASAAWKLHLHAPLWSQRQHRRQVARWSRKVFAILGMRVEATGEPAAAATGVPVLYVANHISWLDIYGLLSCADTAFVAKSEVRDWPLIGRLAERMGTLFIDRTRRSSSREMAVAVAAMLRDGKSVCVFPEGTTTAGDHLAPFRASLIEAAVAAGAIVQPVAIRYADDAGGGSDAAVFIDDMTLPESLWRLACARGVRAQLSFLPAFSAVGLDRRAIAERAESAIAAKLGVPVRARARHLPLDMTVGAIAFDFASR